MPTIKFTQATIETLKPPTTGRDYFWDTATPSFGVRISNLGKKTWVAQYRVNGRSVMETISPVSDMPSLKDARDRATKSRVLAHDGVNPVEQKRAQKLAEKKPDTFGEVFSRYLREYCKRNLRPSTLYETERSFARDILPVLGKRPLLEITRKDIEKLMEHKANHRHRTYRGTTTVGAGVMANRNLSRLRV